MEIFKLLVLLVGVFLQNSVAQQSSQLSVLYEGRSQGGQYIVIPQTYVSEFRSHGFANRAQSTCVTGVWLFYQYENYNQGINGAMEWVFGHDNYCVDFFSIPRLLNSARFAGSPNNYREDSLTLYEETYFQGEEEYARGDLPNLSLFDNHKSLIVTGSSDWTLYDRPNYLGLAICVSPRDAATQVPNFIYDLEDVDVPHGKIQSVRKGCYAKSHMNPNTVTTNSVEGFARGGKSAPIVS